MTVLIGPLLVDWTDYRDTIEDYAEQALGQPVTVLGEIDVRLLPSPSLKLTDVRFGEAENPLVTVSSMTMNAELPPLLRREVIFKELILEQPTLELGIDESGQFIWNFEKSGISEIEPNSIMFGEIRINDGRIIVDDARSADTRSFGGINIVGSARSLYGPFRANGTVTYAGEQYGISMATGTWQQDVGIAVNAGISTLSEHIVFEFNGNIFHQEGIPEFNGDLILASKALEDDGEGSVLKVLNGRGKATISTNVINVEDLSIRIGPEERAVGVQGQFVAELGAITNFKFNLNSKQVNLDRLLGKGPNNPVSTEYAATSVLSLLDSLPVTAQEGIVNLYMAGIVVNGSIIQDIGIQAIAIPTGWRVNNFSAKFPGRTKVTSKGILNLNDATTFQGSLEFESLQPSTYFKWLNVEVTSENLSLDPIVLSMKLDVASGKQSFANINGKLGEDNFHGSVFITQDIESSRSEVIADFDAEQLKYEQIQELADLLGLWNRQPDVSGTEKSEQVKVVLKLHAKEIDFGMSKVALVNIDLVHEGDILEILNFQASDWSGVRIVANGLISSMESSPVGVLEVNLSSSDLTEPISMLGKFFPENHIVGQLAERSDLYSPMTLETRLTIEPYADSSRAIMHVKGALDETKFNANVTMIGDSYNLEEYDLDSMITVNADEGLDLLRQLGLDLLDTAELGNTKLIAKLNGRSNQDMKVNLSYLAKNLELKAIGTAKNFGSRIPSYDLEVSMWSPDINNLVKVTGHVPPLVDNRTPIDLSAEVTGTGRTFRASRISGKYGVIEFSGRVDRIVSQDRQLIKGSLNLSELEFQSLSGLILGPEIWHPADNGGSPANAQTLQSQTNWSDTGFQEPVLKEGRVTLDISSDKFLLSSDRTLNNASFRMTLEPDELAMEDFNADYSGGKLHGNLIVRQSAGEAGLSGTMVLNDVGLDGLFQSQTGQPHARGNLNLVANFESTGRSVADLVKGLNGGGTFSIENGEYSKLNMKAFELIASDSYIAAAIELDNVHRRFSEYLDSGSFKFGRAEGNILISAGQISTRNVGITSNIAEITSEGTIDLNEWEIQSDWSITSNFRDEFSQSKPKVELKFKGAVGNVDRSLDVSKLATYLTIRAFEIENRHSWDSNDAEALATQEMLEEIEELHEENEAQTDDTRLSETDGISQEITEGELESLLETEQQKEVEQQQEVLEKKKPAQELETQDVSKPLVETEFPSDPEPSSETERSDVLDSSKGTEQLDGVGSQDEPESGLEPDTSVTSEPPAEATLPFTLEPSSESQQPEALESSPKTEQSNGGDPQIEIESLEEPETSRESNLPEESEPLQEIPETIPRDKPENPEIRETESQSDLGEEKEDLGEFIEGLEGEDVPPAVQPSNEPESNANEEIQEGNGPDFEEQVKKSIGLSGNDNAIGVEANSAEGDNSASDSIIREKLEPVKRSGTGQ